MKTFWNQYKRQLILSSVITLLPILVGLLLWNQLPDSVPFHWNIRGEVDGWTNKATAVFATPALMLAMQWVCLFACTADPKYANYNPKMLKLALWICPAIGLILCCMVYPQAMGYSVPIEVIMPLLMGILFIVIGNWLPKCQQTYTMGIKLPWTFASEENWNATHRLAGKLWMIGGLLLLLCAFLSGTALPWVMPVVLGIMVVIPIVYSWWFHRNQKGENR